MIADTLNICPRYEKSRSGGYRFLESSCSKADMFSGVNTYSDIGVAQSRDEISPIEI